jgi:uncharacterized membrane protein YjfL (UPF0719 family)
MEQIGSTLLYALLGSLIFAVVIFMMETVTKFSIRKQVVEEGNIALAIVLASIIASLGMIISAAIQ